MAAMRQQADRGGLDLESDGWAPPRAGEWHMSALAGAMRHEPHPRPRSRSREKRTKPYKYAGYPAFCRYIASDNDGFLFRRFGELNARVLLNMQNDIEAVEAELAQLDRAIKLDERENARLDSLQADKAPNALYPRRARLLEDVQEMLHRYSESHAFRMARPPLILARRTFGDLFTSTSEVYRRVSAEELALVAELPFYERANRGPTVKEEVEYLSRNDNDLIAIASGEKSDVARYLERFTFVQKLARVRPPKPIEHPFITTTRRLSISVTCL